MTFREKLEQDAVLASYQLVYYDRPDARPIVFKFIKGSRTVEINAITYLKSDLLLAAADLVKE